MAAKSKKMNGLSHSKARHSTSTKISNRIGKIIATDQGRHLL